jgi:hypothetical protein
MRRTDCSKFYSLLWQKNKNVIKYRQCKYNVILRRLISTVVAVDKQ